MRELSCSAAEFMATGSIYADLDKVKETACFNWKLDSD